MTYSSRNSSFEIRKSPLQMCPAQSFSNGAAPVPLITIQYSKISVFAESPIESEATRAKAHKTQLAALKPALPVTSAFDALSPLPLVLRRTFDPPPSASDGASSGSDPPPTASDGASGWIGCSHRRPGERADRIGWVTKRWRMRAERIRCFGHCFHLWYRANRMYRSASRMTAWGGSEALAHACDVAAT